MTTTGNVISFDESKGYGFVAPDSGGEDVFIHVNDLQFDKHLMEVGKRVEFVIDDGARGPKASRVTLAGPAARGAKRPHEDELEETEYLQDVTEALITGCPSLTGEQILAVRKQMVQLAMEYGWIES
ncbi:cold-shock protein [Amycolatopsis benzoatilytica]|uniref:cold-shock protein n=1 Tax=Amycolatopsis benzoatilytica TaxID=346045 RepID=UPI00037724EC|nr:cold shock domain-containing protein [Amycolatopsis benzoatilytica]